MSTQRHRFRTQVQPGDAAAIERLVRGTGVFSEAETRIARELVEENLARGDDGSGYRFVIADGTDSIDGYACFGEIPATDRRYELYWIAVRRESRRTRLGQQLMKAAEDAVRALDGAYLFAETSTTANYEPARKLYLAQGYERVASIADWHADGDGLEIYGKRLERSPGSPL